MVARSPDTPEPRWGPAGLTAGLILAVFTAIAGFQYFYYPAHQRDSLEHALASKGGALASLTAETIAPALDFDDRAFIDEVLDGVMRDPDARYARVLDAEGELVAERHGELADAPLLELAAAVRVEGTVRGGVRLGLSRDTIAREAAENERVSLAIGAVLLAIGGGVAVLAAASLQRAQQLTRESAARRHMEVVVRDKDAFLATMSHELRTPLNAVLGMAQLLARTQLEGTQRRMCDAIYGAGEGLLALINRHLDLVKLDAGRLELAPFECDVVDVVETCVFGMAPLAANKQLEIVSVIDPRVPARVRCDAFRVTQMLTNLIGNALKFTPSGGVRIVLSLERREGTTATLRFEVIDTGIGVPVQTQARLFLPFVQADAATARGYGGTGLGLSIVKSMAELMGGTVGLRSEPNRGSVFWFTVACEVTASSVPEEHLATPETELALVVAPSEDHCEMVAARLQRWGFTVESCHGDAAAQIAGAPTSLSVVVLDAALSAAELADATAAASRRAQTKIVWLVPIAEAPTPPAGVRTVVRPIRSADLRDAIAGAPVEPTAPADARDSVADIPMRLLVVEDNPVNQEVIAAMLQNLGHQCDLAWGGRDALELLAAKPGAYAAVLMDCQMPEMDGYETTRRLREAERARGQPAIPVIAVTAGGTSDEHLRQAAGMDDVVLKPVKLPALRATLARWLAPETEAVDTGTRATCAVIDDAVVANLMALQSPARPKFFTNLVGTWIERSAALMSSLDRSHEAGDHAGLAAAAHALRGGCLQIGALEVASACAALEARLATGVPGPRDLERVRTAMLAARAALEQLRSA